MYGKPTSTRIVVGAGVKEKVRRRNIKQLKSDEVDKHSSFVNSQQMI